MNEIRESNSLHISWCDSQWLSILSQHNVLDYFSERSNPFYDRTCNNEILKMQRAPIEQLRQMEGIEYILLHCQEPILYVIRKQQRLSPTQATPIADYYIIAGVVYQAPDLNSLINSRILSTVHHLQSAFDESYSYSRFHPSKGYWFEFSKDGDKDSNKEKNEKTSKEKTKEEMSSSTKFQRKRVDILLSELTKRFPPKLIQPSTQAPAPTQPVTTTVEKVATNSGPTPEIEPKVDVKQEKLDSTAVPQSPRPLVNSGSFRSSGGPAEKKPRLN